jgi:hypothetical protein
MPRAIASAPGKVFLFGEHAILYGVTAVAASLSDLRIVVQVVRFIYIISYLLYLLIDIDIDSYRYVCI